MEQKGVQLDRDMMSCSICLDLLKDPVTVPCGHSFCTICLKTHWDRESRFYSCPQCRQTFRPRPVLGKNTVLAHLVEELKKTGLKAAPADHCYAGPEDVACDICTGRKLKACTSCRQCLASYCEDHLQPHFELPVFKKHKLVEPSKNLQENICSRHDEVMKMFCRTDQQSICYLCPVDEHKGHDTVSAAAERAEREKDLEESRENIQKRVQDRERDMKLLQQEVDVINRSADEAVGDSEKMLTEMIQKVKQQVRSQQKTELSRVKDLKEKLEQEITELKRKDAKLQKLSHTEDHNQFLHDFLSLSGLSESTQSPIIGTRPLRYFEDVTAAVSDVREKLEAVLQEKWTNISQPEPEPKTREDFLKYARDITMDPNTVHDNLSLSKGNKEITFGDSETSYPSHPDRFTDVWQVLSTESLTGRCYWEVEWIGEEIYIAVAYKSISRVEEYGFGCDDKSWALFCYRTYSYTFMHNDIETPISAVGSSRIGVYLDHSAGILSFYSVSDTMTLLHREQTTFTEPLHAGLRVAFSYTYTAEFC